jgi:hypothetical protein
MGTQKYANEHNVKQSQRIEKDTKIVWHRKRIHVNKNQAQLVHFKKPQPRVTAFYINHHQAIY